MNIPILDENLYEDIDPQLAIQSNKKNYISSLMNIYWFFDLEKVAANNLLVKPLSKTRTSTDALMVYRSMIDELNLSKRKREEIPY